MLLQVGLISRPKDCLANLQLGLVVRVGDLGVEEELEGGIVFNLRECDVIFIFQYQVFGVLGFRIGRTLLNRYLYLFITQLDCCSSFDEHPRKSSCLDLDEL